MMKRQRGDATSYREQARRNPSGQCVSPRCCRLPVTRHKCAGRCQCPPSFALAPDAGQERDTTLRTPVQRTFLTLTQRTFLTFVRYFLEDSTSTSSTSVPCT